MWRWPAVVALLADAAAAFKLPDTFGGAVLRQARPVCSPNLLPTQGRRTAVALLADAEIAKDLAQQVIGGEGAGDLAQGVVRQAQFLGK